MRRFRAFEIVLDPTVARFGKRQIEPGGTVLRFGLPPARRVVGARGHARLADVHELARGVTLDVAEWLKPVDGRTPVVIVSAAHLPDDERALVLGLLLEEYRSLGVRAKAD